MKRKYLVLVLIINTLFFSCVNEQRREPVENASTQVIEAENTEEKVQRVKKIFYSLPSPIELTMLFKSEGITYQADKLHEIGKRSEYNLTTKKALNLGVYGADLSYAGLFGKHQDAIRYFSTTQLLASDLGMEQTFQKSFISRLEKSADNKDTLLQVMSDFFLENDNYLKNKNQQDLSTYVLAGGWIEGMYLGTEMASDSLSSKGIRKIIAGQKYSLHNLIILLQNLSNADESVELIDKMGELELTFSQLKIEKNDLALEDKNNTLNSSAVANIEVSDSSLAVIKNKVNGLRQLVIQ